MRQTIVSILLVLSSMAAAQVTDYHAHAILDSYRELVAKHDMLLDEGFPLPQWSAEAHLQTPHFLEYKQGTLHMVKSLRQVATEPLAPEAMPLIFKKL